MIGICDNCGPGDEDISLTLDQTLDIHLQPLKMPAVTRLFVRPHPQPVHHAGGRAGDARYRAVQT